MKIPEETLIKQDTFSIIHDNILSVLKSNICMANIIFSHLWKISLN